MPGITPDDGLVIKLAFMLASQIRKIANQAATDAQEESETYWRQFLQKERLEHVYRKSVVERNMLLEQEKDDV